MLRRGFIVRLLRRWVGLLRLLRVLYYLLSMKETNGVKVAGEFNTLTSQAVGVVSAATSNAGAVVTANAFSGAGSVGVGMGGWVGIIMGVMVGVGSGVSLVMA